MNHLFAQRRARLDAEVHARYTSSHIRGLADAAALRGVERNRRNKALTIGAIAAVVVAAATLHASDYTKPRAMMALADRGAPEAPERARPSYEIVSIGSDESRWTPTETRGTDSARVRLETGDVRVAARQPLRVDINPPSGATFTQASLEGQDAVFVVVRQQAAVVVAAERGTLTIRVDGHVHRLAPGGSFVIGDATPRIAIATDAEKPTRPGRRADWRKLARAGELDAARIALRDATPRKPEDMMLAADILRRTGQPAEAESYLRRVVEEHPRHGAAPVAAFTLGKLYLNSLGRPSEAAQMFARVRELSRSGALAEDALAREVESWSASGRTNEARSLARGYLEQHPKGRYAASMRRYAAD